MLNPDPVLQTSISLPFITATADGPKHIETNLSRAKFEELANDLLERCRIPVEAGAEGRQPGRLRHQRGHPCGWLHPYPCCPGLLLSCDFFIYCCR